MSNHTNARDVRGDREHIEVNSERDVSDSVCRASLSTAVDSFVFKTTFIPLRLPSGPSSMYETYTDWSGVLSGGSKGLVRDYIEEIDIADHQVFYGANVETSDEKGSPKVAIVETSPQGQTGCVKLSVHIYLRGGDTPDALNVRFRVTTVPADSLQPTRTPSDRKRHKFININYDKKPTFPSVLSQYVARELLGDDLIPGKGEFLNSFEVRSKGNLPGSEEVARKAAECVEREAIRVYEALERDMRARISANLHDDGYSISTAPTKAEALRRLGHHYRESHKLFPFEYEKKQSQGRQSKTPLRIISDLGLLFLERIRIRPIGHTVERAPFYELSLEPNEQVTLRQKSFSKRATTLESTLEESEEKRLEYSSTFTTGLSEAYSNSVTDSENWGVNASVSGTYGSSGDASLTGNLGGNYGASSSNTDSTEEVTSKARELSRKIETTQKTLHKTVVSIATEDLLEEESIKVIRNDDTRMKKILMRKLMQVLHLSYERYGVRFCWAPCIPQPGRDVRAYVPGGNSFPEEIQAIRDRWANTPPPEELVTAPESKTVRTLWTGKLSGGVTGTNYDMWHSVSMPDGYQYSNSYLEPKQIDGSPNVYIKNYPTPGSTGVVQVQVHVGLSGGLNPENINYRVCVTAAPGTLMQQQYQYAVDEWRRQQAEKEIEEFLNKKKEELKTVSPTAWPSSELMRRIITDYFGDPSSYSSCDVISLLERAFEWENLSFHLKAPWWNPNTEIDGLQSLKTTFMNASWAKAYVPIRPGFEEEALSWLLVIGAIRLDLSWLDDLEYYLRDMRGNLEPIFRRGFQPDSTDMDDISEPPDIKLTARGSLDWENAFEKEANFIVLDRWVATVPTDGVDYEEQPAACDMETPTRAAKEREDNADAKSAESIAKRVTDGDGEISVSVSRSTD